MCRIHSAVIAVALFCVFGCSKDPPAAALARSRPPVKAVLVKKRTITREAGQPGFIEAYEQTALYPKISGFIDKWNVDIGASITEGMTLAHLARPDLVAEHEEKVADVGLAEARIKVARGMVEVAEEYWKSAKSQVDQAKANVGKYKADVDYWTADYKRVHQLYLDKAVDQPVDEASYKHVQATTASLSASVAGIAVAETNAAARKADYEKAKTDVDAALAQAKVARATERRLAALVDYMTIKAPYDGVVVIRNVNKGDFVEPASGDQSSPRDSREMRSGTSRPLYVVARTDKVRIFLDVSEMDANGIQTGSQARINIPALNDLELAAKVTRTSGAALDAKSRALRVEIDVPNPDGRMLSNMYAYGTVELVRPDVWTIPLQAVTQIGNQNVCYALEHGKAVELPVQVGIDDGTWAEVTKKRVGKHWQPFDGKEEIIVGDLSQISNGEPVRLE